MNAAATGAARVQGVRQEPLSVTLACAPDGVDSIVMVAGSGANKSKFGTVTESPEQPATARPHPITAIARNLFMAIP